MVSTLTLIDTAGKVENLEMLQISWVHDSSNERFIEILARNVALGQLQVRIKTSGVLEDQHRLSEFHDKLLAALGRFNTELTAYTGTVVPSAAVDVDRGPSRSTSLCLCNSHGVGERTVDTDVGGGAILRAQTHLRVGVCAAFE